jgi:hypothetical protein
MEQPLEINVQFASSGRRMISRALSAVILSLALAFFMYQSDASQGSMSKAAYLADQAARYDKYLVHPQVGVVVIGFILVCIFFGAYELLSFVIYKVSGVFQNVLVQAAENF